MQLNLVDRDRFEFLVSRLFRSRWRRKQKKSTCPNCHGSNVELVSQKKDQEGYWRKEEYLCYDCDCEWDWTYQRPFFRWRAKIRAPRWAKID
jgi:hypothetical protein